MVDKILTQRPEVKVIDLAKALCDEKRCYGSKDGVLFYIVDDHLSHRGSAYVVNKPRDEFWWMIFVYNSSFLAHKPEKNIYAVDKFWPVLTFSS